ncbi:MAG: hypothetical protein OYM47_17185 [Gemmatimonadota bacterium]|nr:hypothetical protein [Gemmatimonadota bacterium]
MVSGGESRSSIYCIAAAVFVVCCQDASAQRLPGDINGDGQVDFADFVILANNFGEAGGVSFDPSTCGDSVTVTMRDTITIEGPVVTVRDTIFRDHEKPRSVITVKDANPWGMHPVFVQTIIDVARNIMDEAFTFPLDADIDVYNRPVSQRGEGPIVLFSRAGNGNHQIYLDTWGRSDWQMIFQFAHEYGHVLSKYYQTRHGTEEWFEETLAQMASLYVLREIPRRVDDGRLQVPITITAPDGITLRLLDQATAFRSWTRDQIPGFKQTLPQFISWWQVRQNRLYENAYLRELNDHVARNLLDIFEKDPEAWNTVRYIQHNGPVSWDPNQNFGTYLQGWVYRTPARWQKYAHEVTRRFGYFFPERVVSDLAPAIHADNFKR